MKPAVKKIFFRLLVVVFCLAVLGMVRFALWRVNLTNDNARLIDEVRAAGLPISGEEENKYYAEVRDAENAALKWVDAFALMTNFNDQRSNEVASIKFSIRKTDLTAKEMELIAHYCGMNSNALVQAGEATKLTRCRYPIDLSQGAHVSLKHLVFLKHLAQLAALHSIVLAKNPTVDISTILGMARSLDDEPVLISKLVRIVMLNMAVTTLEHRLNVDGLDDSDMMLLGKMFAAAAKTNQMANAFIGDRACFLSVFHMSPGEIAQLADAEEERAAKQTKKSFAGFQYYFGRFAGVFDLDKNIYLHVMASNISLASAFPKSISQINDLDETTSRKFQNSRFRLTLTKMLLPPFRSAIAKEASSLAEVQAAQAALAVERFRLAYGKLPEKLDQLVPQFLSAVPDDPFDSQPLRYKLLKKGYVIYSVGKDGEDNSGRERPADTTSSYKTSYDITFIVER